MNKKKVQLVVLVATISILLITVTGVGGLLLSGRAPFNNSSSTDDMLSTSPDDLLPDNPIDFAALREKNEDIYAWIEIPGTKIAHPSLQSWTEEDNYYIHRDENKRRTTGGDGALYTQKHNSLDFTDPNTVIYGHHNSKGDTKYGMFTALLKFKDEEFFKANKTIYIYTPGHILTYEIFAAYLYDDRHILNSFNLWDDKVFADYLDSCLNPKSMVKNVREGVTLTAEDKIITLSTCYKWQVKEPVRYLVQGVLRNDEPTK